jgi:DNA-binding CsgD family transcriptional regulator
VPVTKWHSWWFDLLLVAMLAIIIPEILSDPPVPWVPVIAGSMLFLAGYLLARPKSLPIDRISTKTDYLGSGLIVAGLCVGAFGASDFSALLTVACPVIWLAISGLWPAIRWNVAMIVMVGLALTLKDIHLGTLAENWTLNLAIVVLPMIFTLMIGSMVHSYLKWGRERSELLEELQASQADLAESYRQLMADAAPPPMEDSPLSPRETEVLGLVSQGCTNREIGNRLFISPATVKTHMENILSKLGATTRTQAVLIAHQEGLLPHQPELP